MDKRSVGFFDSGLGGLTCVEAFKELLPNENIVYLADTANIPYGTKDVSELRRIAKNNLDFLKSRDVKAIVVACGTMSSIATDILHEYDIRTFNVLEPSVEEMAKVKGNRALAVLATNASINSGVFKREIEKASGREVFGVACQNFVKLCESGHTHEDDPLLIAEVERYLEPIKGKVDALLLGCTHFGLVEKAIKNYMPDAEIISASKAAAQKTAEYLISSGMTGGEGKKEIICSGYDIC